MQFSKKDILDMESLSAEEIHLILDTAENMKGISLRPIKKVPTLRGKTVVLFFSTPHHMEKACFEIAAKRMSADCLDISPSMAKEGRGAQLMEEINAIAAVNPDVLVMKRPHAGGAKMVADQCRFSVINAGDGYHAHPSQTLVDMLRVREAKGEIRGLKISLIGDINRSPIARSHCVGFSKLGAKVSLGGPAAMVPRKLASPNISIARNAEAAARGADVVILIKPAMVSSHFDESRMLDAFIHEAVQLVGTSETSNRSPLIISHSDIHRKSEIVSRTPDQSSTVIAVHMAQLYLVAGGIRSVAAD